MTTRIKGEVRDYIVWLGMAAIGLGSLLFHSTLQYSLQLSDELPMLYGTSAQIYSHLNLFNNDYAIASRNLLILYCIVITIIYETSRIPIVFQGAYIALVILTIFYPLHSLKILSEKYPAHKKPLYTMYYWSLSTYLLGAVFWILDNSFCDALREWRQTAHPLLAPLSQGHGYWHLLTGVGGYGATVLVQYMRKLALGQSEIKVNYVFFVYPSLSFPKIKNKQN
jgi:dihydroceramidase